MNVHEVFMRHALLLAEKAKDSGEVPVGAVVVRDGKIIAEAMNEREMIQDPTAHAEVLALRRAAKALGTRRLCECDLYVTLEPCPMCAGACIVSGIRNVYFGAYDQKMGCMGSVYTLPEDPDFMHTGVCSGGVLEQECSELVTAFFQKKR